jgi:hypothetical protein
MLGILLLSPLPLPLSFPFPYENLKSSKPFRLVYYATGFKKVSWTADTFCYRKGGLGYDLALSRMWSSSLTSSLPAFLISVLSVYS